LRYDVEFSEDAERQLGNLAARDRRTIIDAIDEKLAHEPNVQSKHRKRLRENPLAKWELRVGDHRVFYEVEDERVVVLVVAVGTKSHNILKIDGEEFPL